MACNCKNNMVPFRTYQMGSCSINSRLLPNINNNKIFTSRKQAANHTRKSLIDGEYEQEFCRVCVFVAEQEQYSAV